MTAGAGSTLSLAVGKKETATPDALVAATLKGAGQLITGFVESTTVTPKVFVTLAPDASVAVQLTVVVPTGNAEPDAGEQLTVTGATPPLAVTAYVTNAGASMTMPPGTSSARGSIRSFPRAIGENELTRPQITWFDAST